MNNVTLKEKYNIFGNSVVYVCKLTQNQKTFKTMSNLIIKVMETKKQSVKEGKEMIYQCPMKCEGSKTYDQEGNCPVCNMKLIPVDSKPCS